MAYAQWATFNIATRGCNITLKNVVHQWGKFYRPTNKDDEIAPEDLEGKTITEGKAEYFGACGRSDAASGTEGSFDIYDGNTLVASYHWVCPWGSKTNTSQMTPHDTEDYIVQVTGANTDSGALGNISIKVGKF